MNVLSMYLIFSVYFHCPKPDIFFRNDFSTTFQKQQDTVKSKRNNFIWQELSPSNVNRTEGQSIVIDGKYYVFGGFSEFSFGVLRATASNEVYIPSLNQWIFLTQMPLPVTHIGIVLDGKKIWIPGGFMGNNPGVAIEKVQIFDIETNLWSFGPDLPEPMASNAVVCLGRKLHILGGLKPDRQNNNPSHYALNLDNPAEGWQKLADLPSARNHLSAVSLRGKIYAIGGQYGHDDIFEDLPFVHEYNPLSDSWTRKSDLPGKRSHFEPGTITTTDGKIIIVGGRGYGGEAMKEITEYDPEKDTWTELGLLPYGRLAPGAKIIGNELYVSNGGSTWKDPEKNLIKTDFSRSIKKELAFSSQKIKLEINADSILTQKKTVLLWSTGEEINYSIDTEALSSWIHIDKPAGKTSPTATYLNISFTALGLLAGTYHTAVKASATGYPDVLLEIQLKVTRKPFKVLVFNKVRTDRQGFSHASRQAGVDMIRNLGNNSGMWATDNSENSNVFTEANLSQYAVVVWCNTSGNELLTEAQKAAFEKYIQNGGGFVGIHAASDTYRDRSWLWYNRLVGAIVQSSPNHTKNTHQNTMDVIGQHPTTSHLGASWTKTEEYYYWQLNGGEFFEAGNGFVGNQVVLKVQKTDIDGISNTYDNPRPMSWYKEYEGGKSFYTALGHNTGDYTNDQKFIKHIEQAILWASSDETIINSTESLFSAQKIRLYPNPTREILHIEIPAEQAIAKLEGVIYNHLGIEIKRFKLKRESEIWKQEIDMEGFASGSYIILFTDGKRQATKRFVRF